MPAPEDIRIPQEEAKEFNGPMVRVINRYSGDHDKQTAMEEQIDQDEVWVPRGLLRHSSKFFQSATNPNWDALRDNNHTVTTAVQDWDLFKAYVHWLHLGTLPCPTSNDGDAVNIFLAKLYVLGEELMDNKFKNALLDIFKIQAIKGYYPDDIAVNIIYEGTPTKSPARRLLTDFCAYVAHVQDDGWLETFEGYPREALLDALKTMTKIRRRPDRVQKRPWEEAESYHEMID